MTEDSGRAEEHGGELRDAALGVAAVTGHAAAQATSAAGEAARLVTGGRLGHLVGALTRPVIEPLADAGRELREEVAQDELVQRLASEVVDLVVASLDVNQLLAGVDLDALLATVDLDPILARIDLDGVLTRIDLDALAARVDLGAAVARIDVDAVLDRVDTNRLLDRVDPDRLLARVDPNALLDRVDPDRLLARVDPNALLERVDVDAVLAAANLDALIGRIDVNDIVDRVDMDALMAQTELGAIVARSTSGMATAVLDVVRSHCVGLDGLSSSWTNRLLQRRSTDAPTGPAHLVREAASSTAAAGRAVPDRDVSLQGHYAGGVTRLAAYAIDAAMSTALFTAAVAIFGYAAQMVTGRQFPLSSYPLIGVGLAGLWYFLWYFYPWSLSGRTLGMAVVGIRVVRSDGTDLGVKEAFVRTVTFPLSFLVFGLGLVGIVTDRRHRAWHDRFADTAVVYGWDARVARLRFLAKHGASPIS